jgi:hypothetical protein
MSPIDHLTQSGGGWNVWCGTPNDNRKSFLFTVQIPRNIPGEEICADWPNNRHSQRVSNPGHQTALLDKINTEFEQSFSLCATMCFEMGCEEESLACCERCVLI